MENNFSWDMIKKTLIYYKYVLPLIKLFELSLISFVSLDEDNARFLTKIF